MIPGYHPHNECHISVLRSILPLYMSINPPSPNSTRIYTLCTEDLDVHPRNLFP